MTQEERWNQKYKLLLEYYKKNGNIDVPVLYEINGINLGKWLHNQRQAFKNKNTCKLSEDHIDKLNKLGMKWQIVNQQSWDTYYNLLLEYYNKHGNINIPRDYQINGIKLGNWLQSQCQAYKGNGTYKITQEQIDKLNKLGIVWEKIKIYSWNEYYNLLVEYKNEYGNIDVPRKYVKNGIKLGIWLKTQRDKYKYNPNRLSSSQITKLNDLGIKWDFDEENWNRNYQLLKKYHNEHGNIDLPQNYEVNGIKLRRWLDNQKQAFKNNIKSNQEHIDALNKLGIKWNYNTEKWYEIYQILKDYYQRNGNIDLKNDLEFYEVDVDLKIWLQSQRQAYVGNIKLKLDNKKIVLLNQVNIDWNTKNTKLLNKKITDIKVYNKILNKRANYILRDLTLEGINQINSKDNQQVIEKELIKRIWR